MIFFVLKSSKTITAMLTRQLERRPQLSLAELARQSGWSERHFTQVFREQIGFTPKVWHRLQRFQRAVRQLQAVRGVSWAELAISCGYYDQSHFANEFRAFAGIDLTTYTTGLA
jgi:AraC-like DNA-binding protein